MEILTFQLIVLLSAVTNVWGFDIEYYDLNKAPDMFKIFVKDYKKVYTDITDMLTHYEVFKKTLESINEYNSEHKGSSRVYVDEHADMTAREVMTIQDDQSSEYEDDYETGNRKSNRKLNYSVQKGS